MNIHDRIIKVFHLIASKLYVSRQNYSDSRTEIRDSNLNMLQAASLIVVFIFTILFALSFIPFSWKIQDQRFIYLSVVLYTLLIFVISITILTSHKNYITLTLYSFLLILYTYGIFNGVFINKISRSVVFFVVQIVCPILIIDKTVRIATFNTSWTILYIVLAALYKPASIAIIDYVDSVCFLIIGNFMNMYLSHVRTREFLLQQTIKIERDSDGLTGLFNKSALTREINKNLITNPAQGIFMILDIDDFKNINDTFGHDAGDKVLVEISKILKETFRHSDITGRFGGDEFIIFMSDTSDYEIAKEKASSVLEKMLNCLKEPLIPISIKGSFGIAVCSEHGDNFNNLFKKADLALYKSKNNGKNQISVNI